MEADTTESTVDQLIHAAVVARLDSDPALTQQLATLPQATVGQVQQQLQGSATQTPSSSTGPSAEDKIAELSAWVLAELGTDRLTKIHRDRIAEVVARRTDFTVDRIKTIMRMDVDSWKKVGQLRSDRDRRANRPDLATITGIGEDQFKAGYVAIGRELAGGGELLWTGGLAGCLGVVIVSGGACFLAHYSPDQINHQRLADGSSLLAAKVAGIAGMIPLRGANYWLVSQVPGIGYYRAFQDAMTQQGATLAGEFNTTTLAVRTSDGVVFHDFKAPSGFGAD
jgi:hypothetical protein